MEFDNEQLKEIEEFSYSLLHPKDIAVVLQVDYHCFVEQLHDKRSAVYQAFYRGHLRAKAAMQRSLVESAKQGSHPAYKEAAVLLKEATSYELE